MSRWFLALALGLVALSGLPAAGSAVAAPPDLAAFLDRVFAHLKPPATGFVATTWQFADKPTDEAVGMKAYAAVDPEKVVRRVMDVNHYAGNLAHVKVARIDADARFALPQAVRFYQLVSLPVISDIQQELVLLDLGSRGGFRIAAWYLLNPESTALDPSKAARVSYSVGAWIVDGTHIGYALSTAPRHEDVGELTWAALTKGANAMAESVVEANIDGMQAWASK